MTLKEYINFSKEIYNNEKMNSIDIKKYLDFDLKERLRNMNYNNLIITHYIIPYFKSKYNYFYDIKPSYNDKDIFNSIANIFLHITDLEYSKNSIKINYGLFFDEYSDVYPYGNFYLTVNQNIISVFITYYDEKLLYFQVKIW